MAAFLPCRRHALHRTCSSFRPFVPTSRRMLLPNFSSSSSCADRDDGDDDSPSTHPSLLWCVPWSQDSTPIGGTILGAPSSLFFLRGLEPRCVFQECGWNLPALPLVYFFFHFFYHLLPLFVYFIFSSWLGSCLKSTLRTEARNQKERSSPSRPISDGPTVRIAFVTI